MPKSVFFSRSARDFAPWDPSFYGIFGGSTFANLGKRSIKSNFWVWISSGGVGFFHIKG